MIDLVSSTYHYLFVSNVMTSTGLIIDIFGFSILGRDQIIAQRKLSTNIDETEKVLGMIEGVKASLPAFKNYQSRTNEFDGWETFPTTSSSSLANQVRANARITKKNVSGLAEFTEFTMSGHLKVIKLIVIEADLRKERDMLIAKTSLLNSWMGVLIVIIGFVFQFIGSVQT